MLMDALRELDPKPGMRAPDAPGRTDRLRVDDPIACPGRTFGFKLDDPLGAPPEEMAGMRPVEPFFASGLIVEFLEEDPGRCGPSKEAPDNLIFLEALAWLVFCREASEIFATAGACFLAGFFVVPGLGSGRSSSS